MDTNTNTNAGDDDISNEKTATVLETKDIDMPALDPANWDAVQQEINVKVAEAMQGFYSVHSKALQKMERLIRQRLVPELTSTSSSDLKEIADLLRRLVDRVESVEPVIKIKLDEGTLPQPQPLGQSQLLHQLKNGLSVVSRSLEDSGASGSQEAEAAAATVTTILIYRNPRCNGQSNSERDLLAVAAREQHKRPKSEPSSSSAKRSDSYVVRERERAQCQLNLVLLKKSLFSIHLNRHKRYWPPVHHARRHAKAPVHRPVDTTPFDG
ncbi:uncharacterized protein LOC122623612 [Drosophila teissieri]|uniref:uncharacterized protein LOC122623612 n=1 Tax=Drosophila teissieri TaxID=7243 RepID=UPI001CBA151E|nr:uncharacterized protein LOC122623612 [Drosophila teissieri]